MLGAAFVGDKLYLATKFHPVELFPLALQTREMYPTYTDVKFTSRQIQKFAHPSQERYEID